MERSARRRADLILIAALLAAAGIWLAAGALMRPEAASAVVVCQSRDGFYRADPLDAETSYTVETPGTGSGEDAAAGLNEVRISGGSVDVVSANCSNQVCVDHAPASQVGEQIVCLPHGLVIAVVAVEADATPLEP